MFNAFSFLPDHVKSIYFVGIGGISVSSLALMCMENGYIVAGSDTGESRITDKLKKKGIKINPSHNPENVEGYDALVYTSAVKISNPEVDFAVKNNIPHYSRSEFIGKMLKGYKSKIGVSGMHGKSTTTAMITEIYISANKDPSVLCGAILPSLDNAYRNGSGDKMIFEACEYCNSFLNFSADTALILNIDEEHLDFFKTLENIKEAFAQYLSKSKKAVVFKDDGNISDIIKNYKNPIYSYSVTDPKANFFATDIKYIGASSEFTLVQNGKATGTLALSVPGEHNILNALAATAAAITDGIDFEDIKSALIKFTGVKRRFEFLGKLNGADVYDDYAHHPKEIKATLKSAKNLGYDYICCAFQPHTYSRTALFFEDFCKAFQNADEVILTEIYSAREINVYGVTSEQLAEKIKNGTYLKTREEIAEYFKSIAKPGVMLITMGAGELDKLAPLLPLEKI